MRLITSVENRTWYTADGQELLALGKSTAQPAIYSLNAEHLRDLAAACLEAAKELDQRAERAANVDFAEKAS